MVPTEQAMSKATNTPAFMSGLEPLTRRSLLRGLAVSGMAVTTGCSRLFGRKDAPEVLEFTSLSESEARTVTKLTAVLLPTEKYDLPSALSVVPTVKNVDVMVGQMPKQTRDLLGLALWVFESRPMVSFKFSSFSKLDDEKARDYVLAMQDGAFFERGITSTLKTLITVNYWRDSRTWPGLEYTGPVTEKWGVRRLGNAPLPLV